MINTWTALVFAAVCWTIAELSLRSVARLPVEAACRRCRHDLRGSVELRCPECGAMAEGRDRGYWRRRRLSRRGVATLAFVLGLLSLIGPLMSVMPLRVELRSSIAVEAPESSRRHIRAVGTGARTLPARGAFSSRHRSSS